MKNPRKPTLRRTLVYVLSTRKTPSGTWRCQRDIAKVLAANPGTISKEQKTLANEGAITRMNGSRSPVYYKKGPRSSIMEDYIQKFYGQSPEWFQSYAPDVAPPHALAASTPYVAAVEAHFRGGDLQYQVLKVGELKEIRNHDKGGNYSPIHLFNERDTYRIRGSKNYKATLRWDRQDVKIRFQRTDKGNSFFYIHPSRQLLTDAEQLNNAWSLFYDQANAILTTLEGKGGWKFARDEDGSFSVHVDGTIEYAFPKEISEAIIERTGEFGTPGKTPAWVDHSPGSPSCGEFETDDPDLVTGLLNADTTYKDTQDLKRWAKGMEAAYIEMQGKYHRTLAELYGDMTALVKANKEQRLELPPCDGRGYQ